MFAHINDKWQQMRAQLEYVYKYHFDEGDWFLYINDDKYETNQYTESLVNVCQLQLCDGGELALYAAHLQPRGAHLLWLQAKK